MKKPNPSAAKNIHNEFTTYVLLPHLVHILEKLPMCGLCGNSGIVNTIGTAKTPTGQAAGVRAYCICPNGRAIKKTKKGSTKWGGSSVKEHESS